MTIANAFNEITIAQGGTPNYSGTIASAIDALNDALAGSDQPAETTIEGAVRLLGQHIGGGGTLSPATADTLGGVKIGEGINVTEDGTISASGGASVLIVNDEEETLDKTWQEIYDAVNSGSIVLIKADFGDNGYSTSLVISANLSEGTYWIWGAGDNYSASSADGYPAISG